MEQKKWIDINTESFQYSLDHFVIPDHYEDALESVLIPHGVIMDRVEKLAKLIVQEATGPLVVCCVLKGGHQFFADLVNYIKKNVTRGGKTVPLSLEFIKVKSYSGETSGEVKLSLTEEECQEFQGKNILIVEDIIDTGKTMVQLLQKLKQYSPESVKVASLLIKKTPLSNGYIPEYVGFAIPNAFVVGYALDYNEYFRDLDHICVINDHGKMKYAIKN
ncbi:phosphoribosyltransferase-like protein [Lobosporangium transversale]|uniref:Hypoxanthine phosphoribosyltransferase n=1 Tax=Lobosporangium transversale TaxID=64571 RepID=A0A1Y2GS04_9FUNG|nr:phosphoribosyltransferase-like protein [Lobosporangium transversale]ORZ20928.1 phosphoribosyltransferase-like protein [Lobosporangium transversale]|eukprot:XP_021882837.1 phosphoribosyltransferase-like protein [Lobosporangium transversale]